MKKFVLFLVGVLTYFQSSAQNAEVVNAYNYHRNKEYANAKIAIDKAILDIKTGASPKTWYYRGLIYQDIVESPDVVIQSIDSEALNKATESYEKSMELDIKKIYVDDIKKRLPFIQNRYANYGIEKFKTKDFNLAGQYFERAVAIGEKYYNKLDTSLLYNAAIAAQNSKNSVKQKELLGRLITLKYPEADIYRSMANLYLSEKDTTKGLEYIAMGRAAYPNNNLLTIDELNVYMARGQSKQMIEKMEAAAAADPTNKTLHFALGATYDNMGKRDNAEKAYLKAIEIDPNYFDALYNLGAMHYNVAVEVFNKTNDLPMSKQKEYDAGKLKYTASFNKSLPFLEKALELQPNDSNTLLSLKEVYAKTGNLTKSGEMKKRIEGLKKK